MMMIIDNSPNTSLSIGIASTNDDDRVMMMIIVG
jgi:hypothetical protein